MKYSFRLKYPNQEKETLIYFTASFKNEGKTFVYSTGEKIEPRYWGFQNKMPLSRGNISQFSKSIKLQLDRHSNLFMETESLFKKIKEDFTSKVLKKVFDEEFKKVTTGSNNFFESYDEFTSEKSKNKEWSLATIKRYKNIRNLLINFEKSKKYKLTFNTINDKFYSEFTSYCLDDLNHINNTYSRNLGLIKTFMFWSLKNKYTYNDTFQHFKKLEKVITKQIALTIEDLNTLLEFEFDTERLQKVRDVFVFACVTGMRYGELSLIKRSNVVNGNIILKEDKDRSKQAREIPLTNISKIILKKYDYQLPLIANQKQNEYIKEIFKKMGYVDSVQKVTTKGRENIKTEMLFYERISTHTARRTFITMMKRAGKSDKLTASITGHTDMKTLNEYYQVDDLEKKEAMDKVFSVQLPKLKTV